MGDRQVEKIREKWKQKGRMEEKQEIIRRIIKSRKELFDCMLLF